MIQCPPQLQAAPEFFKDSDGVIEGPRCHLPRFSRCENLSLHPQREGFAMSRARVPCKLEGFDDHLRGIVQSSSTQCHLGSLSPDDNVHEAIVAFREQVPDLIEEGCGGMPLASLEMEICEGTAAEGARHAIIQCVCTCHCGLGISLRRFIGAKVCFRPSQPVP